MFCWLWNIKDKKASLTSTAQSAQVIHTFSAETEETFLTGLSFTFVQRCKVMSWSPKYCIPRGYSSCWAPRGRANSFSTHETSLRFNKASYRRPGRAVRGGAGTEVRTRMATAATMTMTTTCRTCCGHFRQAKKKLGVSRQFSCLFLLVNCARKQAQFVFDNFFQMSRTWVQRKRNWWDTQYCLVVLFLFSGFFFFFNFSVIFTTTTMIEWDEKCACGIHPFSTHISVRKNLAVWLLTPAKRQT